MLGESERYERKRKEGCEERKVEDGMGMGI